MHLQEGRHHDSAGTQQLPVCLPAPPHQIILQASGLTLRTPLLQQPVQQLYARKRLPGQDEGVPGVLVELHLVAFE